MSPPKPGCVESEGWRGSSVPTCFSQFPTGSVSGAIIYSRGHLNQYHAPSPTPSPWCGDGANAPATGRSKNQINKTLSVYSPTGMMDGHDGPGQKYPLPHRPVKQSPYLIPTIPLHNHHPRGSYSPAPHLLCSSGVILGKGTRDRSQLIQHLSPINFQGQYSI